MVTYSPRFLLFLAVGMQGRIAVIVSVIYVQNGRTCTLATDNRCNYDRSQNRADTRLRVLTRATKINARYFFLRENDHPLSLSLFLSFFWERERKGRDLEVVFASFLPSSRLVSIDDNFILRGRDRDRERERERETSTIYRALIFNNPITY